MKKYILGLFIGLIGLINFGYCLDYVGDGGFVGPWPNIAPGETIQFSRPWNNSDMVCFSTTDPNCNDFTLTVGNHSITGNPYNGVICMTNLEIGFRPIFINNSTEFYCSIYSFRIQLDLLKPDMTKGECQVEYNLIPVENVDQHYCETNGLCPEYECTGGNLTGFDWSALFINNIQHSSAPLINITIPEEFNWDYTGNDEEFNLSVEGYNVDTEYIDGIIRTQNYKPTSEDFTQLVGMLAPYSKYLLFLLFIFIIWAWIKKPFKSKKL